MKILDLKCEIRQNKRKNNNNKEMNSKCTNYLKQDFKATAPNKKYSVDITYLPTKKGMVYLNVIIDLFGKIPIAYKSSYSCDSKLAEESWSTPKAPRLDVSTQGSLSSELKPRL